MRLLLNASIFFVFSAVRIDPSLLSPSSLSLFSHFSDLSLLFVSLHLSFSYPTNVVVVVGSLFQTMTLLFTFLPLLFFLIILHVNPCFGLNKDGTLLLSLKYSVSNDPLFVFQSWNYSDNTPCSWKGVQCDVISVSYNSSQNRVVSLSLPNSHLLGYIPNDLFSLEYLQRLDLSNNSFNGSLQSSPFHSPSNLKFLDLSNNLISGEIPESIIQLSNLDVLNLSDNALSGNIPNNLGNMMKLTSLLVRNNYLCGFLPSGFKKIEFLDLSSNLLNGSLPLDFGGDSLRFLNISFNKYSGKIPLEFAKKIPMNSTIDISFNNFSGELPASSVFSNTDSNSLSGNPDLCGEETGNQSPVSPISPPAIAAFPNSMDSPAPENGHVSTSRREKSGIRRATIIGIVIGDIVGIGLLALVILYMYKSRRRRNNNEDPLNKEHNHESLSPSSCESKGFRKWSCLRKKGEQDEEENGESESESRSSFDEEQNGFKRKVGSSSLNKSGTLVSVDGEKEMELETLLKASAFILGATGSSIMYKAVLEDGTVFAVRRIGETGLGRFKDFESQVRVVAKLVHPNLVRVRGFYWGTQEKLIIYDFVPNGSLANIRYSKS